MTVQYFNHLTPGVPAISDVAGSLNGLLGHVLPLLGWTLDYTSGGIRVWRNNPSAPGSSGCYFRLDNTTSQGQCRTYKTMSDHSTGTEPIPTTANLPNGHIIRAIGTKWEIIGDDRTFYLHIWSDDDYNHLLYGTGDFDSAFAGNTNNYFSFGPYDDGSWAWGGFCSGSIDNNKWLGRGKTLAINSQAMTTFTTPFGSGVTSGNASYLPIPSAAPYGVMMNPAYVQDDTLYQYNGKLRGCWVAGNGYSNIPAFQEVTNIPPGYTLPFKVFCCGSGSYSNVLMSQENW